MRSHTRYFHPRIRAGKAPFIQRDLFQSCVQCSNKTCCNPDEWRVRVEGLDFFDCSCNMNSWQRAYHAGLTIPHFRGVFPSTLQFFGGGNKSIGVACSKSLSNPLLWWRSPYDNLSCGEQRTRQRCVKQMKKSRKLTNNDYSAGESSSISSRNLTVF